MESAKITIDPLSIACVLFVCLLFLCWTQTKREKLTRGGRESTNSSWWQSESCCVIANRETQLITDYLMSIFFQVSSLSGLFVRLLFHFHFHFPFQCLCVSNGHTVRNSISCCGTLYRYLSRNHCSVIDWQLSKLTSCFEGVVSKIVEDDKNPYNQLEDLHRRDGGGSLLHAKNNH